MIASGVVVYMSCQPVDFRKGPASFMALVRDGGLDPFNGALYVFRSKRADRIRIVWWDGSGVCLYSKTLEDQGFCWPCISAARIRLDGGVATAERTLDEGTPLSYCTERSIQCSTRSAEPHVTEEFP
ncbi:IS66 family insertion sequence element accessory protein TnpB [Agrobacterium tumefaciens]|uniref:IS66 family insertion sequence element accessory protein TnpB n=1 Tax=Agrobacterium tumefaciens TaxID=358 RepID=UPI0015738AB1|nr:IS66 family insertion sequence element accessory protein TnpB [Agrobacterium tumefaciens]NSX89144.1 IS66 family insertion sequence element accessory protein TnpB [Agrobacterium tumefaciens]